MLYDPPARYNLDAGYFETACNAKPPELSIRINGTDFVMNKLDLIITSKAGYDPDTDQCVTAIQTSNGPFILGDVFLKNVVAVFDVGEHQMRFAARTDY